MESASPWSEHRQADGKVYYYNRLTKQSTWDKPEDLKTPEERAKSASPWKEYTAENGRKYYYNPDTKQTTWDMPPDFKRSEPTPTGTPAPASPATVSLPAASSPATALRQPSSATSAVPLAAAVFRFDLNNLPAQFDNHEDAVDAFKQLLRERGVQTNWPWEQAMRHIINHPAYTVLKTIGERKSVFKDYIEDRKREEKEEKRIRAAQTREEFERLLAELNVNVNTRFREVREALVARPTWQLFESDRDRESAFDDYIEMLRKREREELKRRRGEGVAKFTRLLESMTEITHETTWEQAQELFLMRQAFQDDIDMSSLPLLELLTAFEDHLKGLERNFEQQREAADSQRKRKERQNRDAFKATLAELQQRGKLHARTSWADIVPLIRDDARLVTMIGQAGSSPLDLFYDKIEELEELLSRDKKAIKELLKVHDVTMTPHTPKAVFLQTVNGEGRTASITDVNKGIIFEELLQKAVRREEDQAKHDDKKRQKKADAFLSLLRKHDVTAASKWEEVRPSIVERSAFSAIESEEQRVELFAQYQRELGGGGGSSRKRTHDDAAADDAREPGQIDDEDEKAARARRS